MKSMRAPARRNARTVRSKAALTVASSPSSIERSRYRQPQCGHRAPSERHPAVGEQFVQQRRARAPVADDEQRRVA